MRILVIAGFVALGAVYFSSCSKDKVSVGPVVDPECPDTISFANTIEPLIDQNCATSGCHGGGSAAGGYNLEGYSNVNIFAQQMLSTMRHEQGFTAMPFSAPQLPDSLIKKFGCWIKQGKLNN